MSIVLLSINLCQGRCYDRALFATFGMGDDDFQLVDADIDSLTLNPNCLDAFHEANYDGKANVHYGNHCFLERNRKDGSIWIYDTTDGLVYGKNYIT